LDLDPQRSNSRAESQARADDPHGRRRLDEEHLVLGGRRRIGQLDAEGLGAFRQQVVDDRQRDLNALGVAGAAGERDP